MKIESGGYYSKAMLLTTACTYDDTPYSFRWEDFKMFLSTDILRDVFPSDRCIYCGTTLDDWEGDHFPIPAQCDGEFTVRACSLCHHIKDRKSYLLDCYIRWLDHNDRCLWANQLFSIPLVTEFIFGRLSIDIHAMLAVLKAWTVLPPAIRLRTAERIVDQILSMYYHQKGAEDGG